MIATLHTEIYIDSLQKRCQQHYVCVYRDVTESVILSLGSLGGRQLTSILVVVTLVMTGGDRPLGRLAMVVTSMDGL